MKTLPESPFPRTTSDDAFTIWIARTDGPMRSHSVWRGPRTVAALSELLAKLDALGVVEEEWPITVARAALDGYAEADDRATRHRRAVGRVRSLLETFRRAFAPVGRGQSRDAHQGPQERA